MKKLIIPSKLNEGDTVAFISISGGRAGDEDMIPRYLLGKRRFEKIFHVKVVETPHALRGSGYLYEHPEKRAEDLMWALKNDSTQSKQDMIRDSSTISTITPVLLKSQASELEGFTQIANTLMARDYKGFGNEAMNGVIECTTLQ